MVGIMSSGNFVGAKAYHIPNVLFLNQSYQFDYYFSANYRYNVLLNFTSRTNLNISDMSLGSNYSTLGVKLFGRNKLN